MFCDIDVFIGVRFPCNCVPEFAIVSYKDRFCVKAECVGDIFLSVVSFQVEFIPEAYVSL